MVINALSALRGGGQTYLLNLLENASAKSGKITVIVNTENAELFSKFESDYMDIIEAKFASKNILFRVLWEFFVLPFWLFRNKSKQYYAPGGIMISFMPPCCKSFTALRNMLPFDKKERQRFPIFSYIRFKLWLLRFIFLLSYRMADGVIFISNYSRDVVEQYIPDIRKKSVVISHGLNEGFRRSDVKLDLPKTYGLEVGAYYLYVSILDVYKAQKEVIKSWEILYKKGFRFPLVLVGPSYNDYGKEIQALVSSDTSGLLHYMGPVEYEKLPALYQNARALIFASSCECCPNILLEKLSSGRPVFSSFSEPMPEFGGDAAIYFEPYEPSDLVEKLLCFESDMNNFDKYADLAFEKSKEYDWQKTTDRTLGYIVGEF